MIHDKLYSILSCKLTQQIYDKFARESGAKVCVKAEIQKNSRRHQLYIHREINR